MSRWINSPEDLAEKDARRLHLERVKHNIAYQFDNKLITRRVAEELARKAGLPHWIWGPEWDRDDATFRKMFDPPSTKVLTEEQLLAELEQCLAELKELPSAVTC